MCKDLNSLKIAYETNEELSSCMLRQGKNTGEEKYLMRDSLLELFFNDEIIFLQKHFDQWRSIVLIRTCFLSELDLDTHFCRWNLGLELPHSSMQHTFINRTINIPSLFIFLVNSCPMMIFNKKHLYRTSRGCTANSTW